MSTINEIKLISIEIKDFKGIKDFLLKADGETLQVFGDNKTGKTTIEDALKWCLFNKDAKDREQFNWKPLDANNEPIHHLVTQVITTLSINGKHKEFAKYRSENWSTERGTGKKYFKDETTYKVDGLEISTKKIYDEKVAEIADESTFKYLTSVTYFNEVLSPEERRETLFKYFGTKTDLEIINENENLKPLIEIIGDGNIKDAQEKLMQTKKSLAKSIKEIPVQIKGIQKALPDLENLNQESLNSDKQELIIKQNDLENDLLEIKNGSAIAEKQSSLRTLHSELKGAESSHTANQLDKVNGIEAGKSKLFEQANLANDTYLVEESRIFNVEREIESSKKHVTRLVAEREILYAKYDKTNDLATNSAEIYNPIPFDEHLLVCQPCQREYEADQKELIRKNHQEAELAKKEAFDTAESLRISIFETDKQARLEAIKEEGKALNEELEVIDAHIVDLSNQIADRTLLDKLFNDREAVGLEYNAIKATVDKLKIDEASFEETNKYKEIMAQVAPIEKSIISLQLSVEDQVVAKETEIGEVKASIRTIDEKLSVYKEYGRQQGVIDQLGDDERRLAAEKGEVETKLILFDQFFITKVRLLETNINKHFKFIKFKLFDFYDEGGLNESVCEPVVDGVPFRDLNNANRINAGLDVANTLMAQEGIKVPLFVDNAEAVTQLLEIETQVIAMYVSEKDKSLRVEKIIKEVEAVA